MKFLDEVKFHILLIGLAVILLVFAHHGISHGEADFGKECMHKCWEVLAALLALITGRNIGQSSPNVSTPPDAAKK